MEAFGGDTWSKETTWETRRRWEDNIKCIFMRRHGLDLSGLGYGQVAGAF